MILHGKLRNIYRNWHLPNHAFLKKYLMRLMSVEFASRLWYSKGDPDSQFEFLCSHLNNNSFTGGIPSELGAPPGGGPTKLTVIKHL